MLEQAGYESVEAGNGCEGLALLQARRPDVVTCDLNMPLMNGFEFLEAAKQEAATQDVPVIVITALGQEEAAAKAVAHGAAAYLTKPFSASHLVETIQRLLK
jgi:CheY-like chemotaxis protein